MKKTSFPVIFLLAILTGCSSQSFYRNGPIDAKSFQQNVSVEQINNENSKFNIYKIDSKYYGIRHVKITSNEDSFIGKLNDALIFTDDQLADFKATCQKIINAYSQSPKNEIEIIEYHLTLNIPETVTSYNATIFSNYFSTNTQIKEFNRVIFRLQFANQKKSLRDLMKSGKEISVMFYNQTDTMSIEDLKALLNDLNK